jgi:GNAT superfamily N-acetyltransferase
VASLVEAARDRGIRRLLTGALAPGEQATFRDAGFAVHDRLHLLSHDLEAVPAVGLGADVKLRRARRGELGAVLAVDGRAFDGFWRLDRAGLDDAIHATTSARVRVATDGGGAIVGYVVTGRSGDRGYVQRLAVDPTARRNGIGAALVVDGLRWLRRRRTLSAVVNTQVANDGALALYRRLGFVLQPDGLTVLTLPLTDAEATAPGSPGDPW